MLKLRKYVWWGMIRNSFKLIRLHFLDIILMYNPEENTYKNSANNIDFPESYEQLTRWGTEVYICRLKSIVIGNRMLFNSWKLVSEDIHVYLYTMLTKYLWKEESCIIAADNLRCMYIRSQLVIHSPRHYSRVFASCNPSCASNIFSLV